MIDCRRCFNKKQRAWTHQQTILHAYTTWDIAFSIERAVHTLTVAVRLYTAATTTLWYIFVYNIGYLG